MIKKFRSTISLDGSVSIRVRHTFLRISSFLCNRFVHKAICIRNQSGRSKNSFLQNIFSSGHSWELADDSLRENAPSSTFSGRQKMRRYLGRCDERLVVLCATKFRWWEMMFAFLFMKQCIKSCTTWKVKCLVLLWSHMQQTKNEKESTRLKPHLCSVVSGFRLLFTFFEKHCTGLRLYCNWASFWPKWASSEIAY